jgi:hypothetical protein
MKATESALCLLSALLLVPAAVFGSASALGQSVALNRMVTPNGDGRNDTFIFRCHNPRDSGVEAKIFDLAGREVALMRLKQRSTGSPPAPSASGEYYDFEWNPNSEGKKKGGVYVYQVSVETSVYKGTIVVIR